jgi:amino acid adenylation domain-containing protein
LIRFLPSPIRADGQSSIGPRILATRALSPDKLDLYRGAAMQVGVELKDLLLAGFAALLSKLSRQETLTISVRYSQVKFHLDAESSIARLALSLSGAGLSGNVQPGAVLRQPLRGSGGALLSSVGFAFHASAESEDSNEFQDSEDYGLLFSVVDGGRYLQLISTTRRWHDETLGSWLDYLRSLLDAASREPQTLLSRLPLWSESAARSFYARLNQTLVEFHGPPTVVERFVGQARKTPETTAVIGGERRYTYRELDQRSDTLAQLLLAEGAGTNRAVAVCMERTIDLPSALLAVLKSGGFYVPLEPSHPGSRLSGVVEECCPVALITDSASIERVRSWLDGSGVPVILADQASASHQRQPVLAGEIDPESLAYTIYTSGTTGKPKGVRIQHRALANLIGSIQREPGMSASDRALAVAPISFDIASMDMFLAICTGATLVLANRTDAADPYRLARLIDVHRITSMQATPATWRLLITAGWKGKRDLKILCGGEALSRELANSLLPLCGELWNCYGPTETTIWSAVLRIQHGEGIVPVGPPMANTSFYVLDDSGNPLPPGVPGELCIGGQGVSVGYVARPELNAARFIPDRFGPDPEASLFRTGDLVRLVDGNLFEFFGRLDHQVKLRGYRIELGEIESVLRTHPKVTDAVVIVREDIPGEPRLVAYVITPDQVVEARALVEFAAKTIPEYMLPSAVVPVERFPLSASGKIDRRALPAPESQPERADVVHPHAEDPADELEERLLTIFRDTLRNNSIGVTDSFFRFGGYSLLTIRLFARIDRELHARMPISMLFDAPTVRELARVIRSGITPSVIVPIRPYGKSAPIFLVQSYLLYSAMLEMVEPDRPIYGVRELGDESEPLTVADRARQFAREILAVYPHGPLYLAGWCAAGTLTVEIARQLREAGHEVGLVALFDAERPGFAPPRNLSALGVRARNRIVFHWSRLRGIDWRQRASYLRDAIDRNHESLTDVWYAFSYRFLLWLNKHFSIALPATTFHRAHANMSAQSSTQVRPYPGKLNLYRAADVPDRTESDTSLGWAAVAGGGVVVDFVAGDHVSMFKQPHVHNLAGLIQEEMRRYETASARGHVAFH